jgi:homogentisate 1,2-dioxygenase
MDRRKFHEKQKLCFLNCIFSFSNIFTYIKCTTNDTMAFLKQRTEKYQYQPGFGNHFSTEALPNTLPIGQNSPQVCPRGLYAEQLSGAAFTVPRTAQVRRYADRFRKFVSILKKSF